MITLGWGLDLARPEHHGHSTRWRPSPETPGCVRAHDTEGTIVQLQKNWTLHVRAEPAGRTLLDARFNLTGSSAAIAEACTGRSSRPRGQPPTK